MMFLKAVSAGRRIYPVITKDLNLYLDAYNNRSYAGTGNTWYDLSKNAYNFTNNGGTWTVSGGRRYWELDGVNDYLEGSGTTTLFNLNSTGWTWSLWVYYVTAPGFLDAIVGSQFDGKMPFYIDNRNNAFTNGNGYRCGTAGNVDVFTQYDITITTGTWIHVCGTWTYSTTTTGTFKIYLDGLEKSSSNVTTQAGRTWANQNNNTPPNVGALKLFANYVRFNNIRVGEVLHYTRALTGTEVSDNYNSTKTNYGL